MTLATLMSCNSSTKNTLVIENCCAYHRTGEVIEIEVENPSHVAIFDRNGKEQPTQVTSDGKLLLLTSVDAGSSVEYEVRQVENRSTEFQPITFGRIYPERLRDMAWENDKIGFRIYSEDILDTPWSKLYGLDIFTKKGTEPVLDDLYKLETNKVLRARVDSLKKVDPVAGQLLYDSISYHIDKGQGMDYYAVGPTLGCGTAALANAKETFYTKCFTQCQILDQGPLRIRFVLDMAPVVINGDSVVERRTYTLDAGSHFNHIEVEYKNLSNPMDLIAGLVLHDEAKKYMIADNAIAYAEPVNNKGWQTYNAIIHDLSLDTELDRFDAERQKSHGGAFGHLQVRGLYEPGQTFSYYAGAGWNGWGFPTANSWFDYVKITSKKLNTPLHYFFR